MQYAQFIDNQWCQGESSHCIRNKNPYQGELLCEIQGASIGDVNRAYEAAAKAQPLWAACGPHERAEVLERAAAIIQERHAELVDWMVKEVGAVRRFAEVICGLGYQITKAAATYPFLVPAQLLASPVAGKESRVYHKPLGVVTVITPWNAPLILSARAIAPALALGNAVVLKPASDTPVTGGLLLAEIFSAAGLPKGLLNVVIGDSQEIGDVLLTHPLSRHVSFTGSTEVGRNLYAKVATSKNLKRVSLELGGNAPFIVLDDANIDQAVSALVIGRFLHQGQICMSANRAIIDAKIYDHFVEKLLDQVQKLPAGDPQDITTVIGPLINSVQVERVLSKIEKAKSERAAILLGGQVSGSQHNIIAPHIFANVEPHFSIVQEESFGPLLPLLKAQDEAHALMLANQTEYGLSSAIFTQDSERGRRFAQQIEAGMTHINDHSVADVFNAPFGGEKNSGFGRFNGQWIVNEYTRTHWITNQ